MTPLAANLRHLYQWRGMWLMYVLLALMSLPIIPVLFNGRATDCGMFAYPLLSAFVAGTFMSHHVLAIMASPLSFCLPGHQKVARQFVVIVGVVISMVLALVFLAFPALPWPLRLTALIWAFSANLAVYGWGSQITVSSPISSPGVGALIGWSWLLAVVAVYFDAHIAIVNAIIEANLLFIGACLILAVYTLSYWGKRDVARGFCGTPKLIGFEAWNAEKVRSVTQARWAARGTKVSRIAAFIERLFIGRMDANRPLGTARTIWGGLYASLGGIAIGGNGLIFLVVFIAIYFGYIGSQMSWFIFMIASIMAGTWIQHTVYSVLPVPQGRRERFFIGIGVALMGSALTAVVLGAAVWLTYMFAPIAPDLSLKGTVFRFQAMEPWGLWIPWAILPVVQTVRLIWPKRWLFGIIACFALTPVITLSAVSKELLPAWTVPVVVVIVIASWSAFLAVLRWVCFRRDLVIQ